MHTWFIVVYTVTGEYQIAFEGLGGGGSTQQIYV